MIPPQHGPWNDHRMVAESIGEAVALALSSETGSIVDLGKAVSFDPEAMLPGRPLPLRAIVVHFRRPLRDVMVFLTSHKDEQVRPLIEAAARATIKAIDVPTTADQHGPLGRFQIEPVVEFDSLETALEQCDALYLEATYSLEMPTGELRMVVGTGLLQAASSFARGVVDPFADGPAYAPASADLQLADDIQAGMPVGALELAATPDSTSIDDVDLGVRADPAQAANSMEGIEAFDAVLAAQEHAEAAASVAADAAHQARSNVAAAELEDLAIAAATQRWTQLLSGVEVELSAELGRAELSLGDITSLESERVLTLDQMVHEPVSVYVNGTRYATARLVVVDGEYGIEILEVVEQEAFMTTLAA